MKIKILGEYGLEFAMLGLSLSYNQPVSKMYNTAEKLAKRNLYGGELQFLEQIIVWINIQAPLYWWGQFDKYRVGIADNDGYRINVPKQSESTMHTILKRELTQDDFEKPIYSTMLNIINNSIRDKDFDNVNNNLPRGFLQRRIICTNYKTLIHIINQRHNHKLQQWQIFNDYLIDNLELQHIIKDLVK